MTTRTVAILHLFTVHIGWFGCILGAAYGYPMAGPVLVALLLVLSLKVMDDAPGRLRLTAILTAIGTFVDSAITLGGYMAFDSPASVGENSGGIVLVPLWMIALWVNFSTAVRPLLGFLRGRVWLAVPLGAFGGAMAYRGGAVLGALTLPGGYASLLVIGVEWAILLPLAVWLDARSRGVGTQGMVLEE
ncbi:MAG: DUF2878 domain-containing protein [Phycisphaerae bacterium]